MHGYHILISLYPSHKDNSLVPISLFGDLQSPNNRNTSSPPNPKAWSTSRDYRLGPITIDWIDFHSAQRIKMERGLKGANHGKDDPRRTAVASFQTKTGGTTKEDVFGSARLPQGVVHIFRERDADQNPQALEGTSASVSPQVSDNEGDGVTLAVLAVPSYMTPADFLTFVAPAEEGMSHLRMIRDASPNRSMVLIKFRDRAYADDFAETYNGRAFNSIQPEICHVVHVLSVDIEQGSTPEDRPSSFPRRFSFGASGGAYELPTCPVCLERMDSAVTGLVTVPCSHTFHCMCLSKWGDSRCPVCRYSQTLLTSHPRNPNNTSNPRSRSGTTTTSTPTPFFSPSTPTLSICSSCPSTTNLWICLICGNVGCGRYARAHAHEHYMSTSHLYALELETQRVWDYAGDGYVHRLIQNKADGKLVELPSTSAMNATTNARGGDMRKEGPSEEDQLSAEKIEAIGIEYSYLLTSQLDSQRAYYEEQTLQLQETSSSLHELLSSAEERVKEEQERAEAAERGRLKAEARLEKHMDLMRRLERDLKEERAVSQGLIENLTVLKGKVKASEEEKVTWESRLRELEDQLRDVMFFLEAREKIKEGEEGGGIVGEAAGGTVELPPLPSPTTTSPQNGAQGKKKKKSKK